MKPEDRAGTTVGGCRLERLLGQGACGAVFLAEQISLQRPVAVKILTDGATATRAFLDRFIREARVIASLDSRHVIRVYDMGTTPAGEPYIVMELVDGMSIEDLLESQGTLSEFQAADIIRQSAIGVAAAAAKGVVHRDIKPANLMLTREGVVKVADFGLAKAGDDQNSLTQTGAILGTPFYMAPEVAKGESIDTRADVYSLGVTLYHLLVGDVPYRGSTAIAVLYHHVNTAVPNLCEMFPGQVSEEISAIICKTMAKNPAERYATASDLARALADFLGALGANRPPALRIASATSPTSRLAQDQKPTTSGVDSRGFDDTMFDLSLRDAPLPLDDRPVPSTDSDDTIAGVKEPEPPRRGYSPWGPVAERPGAPGIAVAAPPPRPAAKRTLLVCLVEDSRIAGRRDVTSIEIDSTLGLILGTLQSLGGGEAKRSLDRIVVVLDTPALALELLRRVTDRMKESAPRKGTRRDHWTLRALIHTVGIATVDQVSEHDKVVAFGVIDMLRQGTVAISAAALELMSGADKAPFKIDPARPLQGRGGAIIIHGIKRK